MEKILEKSSAPDTKRVSQEETPELIKKIERKIKDNRERKLSGVTPTENSFELLRKNEPMPQIKSNDVFSSSIDYPTTELSGVFCKGVQYFDFGGVQFINHAVMARLIYLLKSFLKQGIEIRLVNVRDEIKSKISSMGLSSVLNCA